MRSAFYTLILLTSVSFRLLSQDSGLEGYVYTSDTGEPVADARVEIAGDSLFVYTNKDGYFKLVSGKPAGQLWISHFAFDSLSVTVPYEVQPPLHFYLRYRSYQLPGVELTAGAAEESVLPEKNLIRLNRDIIEKVPGFMGVRDPLRALQSLPGFANGGEGNGGLYARGGGAGQNLVLFNGAPVYNPSHLLGLFSVFNPEAVERVDVYKSGLPPRFEGRLSSVIDLKSVSGPVDSVSLEADISSLYASGNLRVPLRPAWSVSAFVRKSYMNRTLWPLLRKIQTDEAVFRELEYDFFDINILSSLQLRRAGRLSFSAYLGGDDFGLGIPLLKAGNTMDWKNAVASVSWEHEVAPRLSLSTTAYYTGYFFSFGLRQGTFAAEARSAVNDAGFRGVMDYRFSPGHLLRAGVGVTDHFFKPVRPQAELSGVPFQLGEAARYPAGEWAVFFRDEYEVTPRLFIHYGARLTRYRYRGKDARTYTFVEPGAVAGYSLGHASSIKGAFSANTQTVHLVPVSAANFPFDFWVPSTGVLPPARGLQFSLGYFTSLQHLRYEAYADLYYKKLRGLLEYTGGVMGITGPVSLEDQVLGGTGESYGIEFYLKKNSGRLTGQISYTLSKNSRTFGDLNEGRPFPFKYDRRHAATLVAAFRLGSSWSLGAMFTFSTGHAFTAPASRYLLAGNVINQYSSYNGSRMPDYHRFDLSATWALNRNRSWESTLVFSFYNVYARANPVYQYFQARGDLAAYEFAVEPKSLSLLPFLPALNYKIAF